MNNRKIFNKSLNRDEIVIKSIIIFVLFAILILSFLFSSKIESLLGLNAKSLVGEVTSDEMKDSKFKVCYIDVGQGSSTLVKLPDGKVMLIDGGSAMYSEKVVNFLKSENVSYIDYLIASHADSDHIGSLVSVLENFDVKHIFRPFQIAGTGETADTFLANTYEDLAEIYMFLQQKYNNNAKISRVTSEIYNIFINKIYNEKYEENGEIIKSSVTVFYDGLVLSGENYSIEFFAPLVRDEMFNLEDYSNTKGFATVGYGVNESNGNSAIFLLKVFNEKFLFTGDAPCLSGEENSNKKYEELDFIGSLSPEEIEGLKNISVYLVGHHGSSYSSSNELLDIINPLYNIISVGESNDFGHPSNKVLERLYNHKRIDDYLFMTSEQGTITFGMVDEKLVYILEKLDNTENLIISWYALGTIIFIFLSYLIISIKFKKYDKI